jgi:hypothetical protein
LINSARLHAGKSTVGWVNPSIYECGTNFTTDIVGGNDLILTFSVRETLIHLLLFFQGENNCAASHTAADATCCEQGFTAITGWDPVTGFGSVNYANLLAVFGPGGLVDDDSGSHHSDFTDADVIAVSVVGGVVGAGAIGAAVYYSFFAKAGSTMTTPLIDPVEATKSPMV